MAPSNLNEPNRFGKDASYEGTKAKLWVLTVCHQRSKKTPPTTHQ